jgi:hypothetical protein
VIVDVVFLLIGVAGLYFVQRATAAIVEVRRDVLATRKQVKEVLRNVQKTEVQSKRILERAYHHQQEINALMANPNVVAAIEHAEKG